VFDAIERLRDSRPLSLLLTHYADLGTEDRQIWQDRLMQLEGVEAKELTQLHGDLIAQDWVELNAGFVDIARPGVVGSCYRVTAAGVRALKLAAAGPEVDLEAEMEAAEKVRSASGEGENDKKRSRKRATKQAEVAQADQNATVNSAADQVDKPAA